MKKIILIFLLLLSLNAHSIDIKSAYICIAEASTGFLYEKNEWKILHFSKRDFLIRKLKEGDPGFNSNENKPYAMFELSETIPHMYCSIRGSVIECSGLGKLQFALRTGLFIRTDTLPYVGAEEDAISQPKITQGICKPLPKEYKEPPKKVYPPKL